MSNYLDTTFPYYPADIRSTKPLGNVTLREFIRAVSNPQDKVKQLFIDIKKASQKGDLKLKNDLKKGLYFFNPCVNLDGNGRSYKNIISFTGLLQFDVDSISNPAEFRDWFFENCSSCAVCGISSSGYGVKGIIRIPIVSSVEEYKTYFYGIGYYMEEFKGYDISPQNPVLPLYLFYDPDTRWRDDATVSTVRGEKINSFKPFEGEIRTLDEVVGWKKQKVIDIFSSGINNIVDNGHPQVIGYCSMLGGYIASNYLSEDEATVLLEDRILDNEYLSKDYKGYIKTGLNMMQKGMSGPLYLKCDQEDEK